MPTSHPPQTVSCESLLAFQSALKTAKHDISNTFAVLLALAELAEANPSNYQRLAQLVIERCPKVISELQSLQDNLACLVEEPKLTAPHPSVDALPTANSGDSTPLLKPSPDHS